MLNYRHPDGNWNMDIYNRPELVIISYTYIQNLMMDIHNWTMGNHNWIMNNQSFMDIQYYSLFHICGWQLKIMDIHNSVTDIPYCELMASIIEWWIYIIVVNYKYLITEDHNWVMEYL